jgi:hypothetical protein
MEVNPHHLAFTEELLPDGTWRDMIKVALQALKPAEAIVVSRLVDIRLYLLTMADRALSNDLAGTSECGLKFVATGSCDKTISY